jgi:hypothetical protein
MSSRMFTIALPAVVAALLALPVRAVPLDSKAFTIEITLTVTSTNPLVLEGVTNLPDGMKLHALLEGYRHLECGEASQRKCKVNSASQSFSIEHGHFKLTPEPDTNIPPTLWTLSINNMNIAQPANVIAVIGGNGEHMLGPYIERAKTHESPRSRPVYIWYTKSICVLGQGSIQPYPFGGIFTGTCQ